MDIAAVSQSQAWVSVIERLQYGDVLSPRGMLVKEIPERVTIKISDPSAGFVDSTGRSFNYAITAVEAMSLVGQVSIPEAILDRVGAFAPYANDGIFWGAYGPRVAGDLANIVELLTRDPDSRQAVATVFESGRDLGRPGVKDVPCTIAVQFFLREEQLYPHYAGEYAESVGLVKKLHMWVVMRSNDAWLGLPYDLGQFSILQMAMAQALSVKPGSYTHSVGSMHLYEKHWDAARSVGSPVVNYVGDKFQSGSDIQAISSRARRLLIGGHTRPAMLGALSPLETWLFDKLE